MNKILLKSVLIILLCISITLLGQGADVTHVYPEASLNDTIIPLHVYGDSFAIDTVYSVSLIRSGFPEITGTSINVISDLYLTCDFNFTGDSTGLYDVVIANTSGSDTLRGCFTLYSRSASPYIWERTVIGSGSHTMWTATVGDGNNDGELEVYAQNEDDNLYQFKMSDTGWVKTVVGTTTLWMYEVAVADGDNDGELEVYGANTDGNMYQFKWNGSNWVRTSIGSGSSRMTGVAVGDGNHDGESEVYGTNMDRNLYQFKWNGAGWDRVTISSGLYDESGVIIGDGNNNGEIEIYCLASNQQDIYQFKWNDTTWIVNSIGSTGYSMQGIDVGDGDNDGEMEVYGVSWGRNVYQFTWNGLTWDETSVGSCPNGLYSVVVGDGNGDGEQEIYGVCGDANLYQFKWNGSSWPRTTVATNVCYRKADIGDGNCDGEMEIFTSAGWGPTFQCKAVPFPDIELSDTYYDFGDVSVGDSLDWQYLVISNIGNDTLFVDSLLSDTADYTVLDTIFPHTLTPEDSTLLTVRFKPSILDTIAGTLTVYSNDPYNAVIYVSLLGVGVDVAPPVPFSLISPLDSAVFTITRPTFIWGSSFDLLSGLQNYEVYIDDTLRNTTIDTVWLTDYDLSEGWHNWYVIAYDSSENPRNSIENWSLLIDTTSPSVVTLIEPSSGSYLSDSIVAFIWNQSDDNLSGVDYYILQYTPDSNFLSSVADTTVVDTVFSAMLSDTTYCWRVKVVDVATNESDWSLVHSFEVDTRVPSSPVLISPIGGIYLGNDTVLFEWSEVGDLFRGSEISKTRSPIEYVFQLDTSLSFSEPLAVDTLSSVYDTLILSENKYFWRAKAFDYAGNQSYFSNPDSFGVDITPPFIESTTVLIDTSYTGPFPVYTNVTDFSRVDSVMLYYRREEDPTWFFKRMVKGTNNWYQELLPQVFLQNDTVKYYILANDIAMPSNESTDPPGAPANYYSFVVNVSGIEEGEGKPRMFSFLVSSVGMNAAVFKVDLPEQVDVSLNIYDITGRIVSSPASGSYSAGYYNITFRPEKSGIYFYLFKSAYGEKKGKIVVF